MKTSGHQGFQLLTVCAVFWAFPTSATSAGEWFTLIHTNDILSHFDETGSSECPHVGRCLGGIARLVRVVKDEKALGHDVLVVDAGNMLNTRLMNRTSAETLITKLVKQVNYDVAGIGLFELYGGPERLDKYIAWLQKSGTKVICSNLSYNISGQAATRCDKSTVVKVGHLKIGFVSYISPNVSFLLKEHHVDKSDELEITTAKHIPALVSELYSRQDADIVICIYLQEQCLVTAMDSTSMPFTDIFIAAFKQGLHWNVNIKEAHEPVWYQQHAQDGPMGERVFHTYPSKVKVSKREAYLVTAGRNLLYAGRIRFKVQSKAIVQFEATNPRILTGMKDQEAEKIMASVRQHQMTFLGGYVGETPYTIDGGSECGKDECSVGNLVADALLHASFEPNRIHDDGLLIGWSSVTAALVTSYSLDAIYRGVITSEDILHAYNYNDGFVVFDITGKRLLEALSNSIKGEAEPLQVSGLRFTIQLSSGGKNVSGIKILCSVCIVPTFDDVDEDHTYRLVTTDYSYEQFTKKGYFLDTVKVKIGETDIKEVIKKYIELNSPILQGQEGRFKIIEA